MAQISCRLMIGLTRCSKKHLYSITSLARRSNEVGTVRPSALAVFMYHPVDAGAERRRKFERSAPAINLRAPGDYLFKCRDCKHNGGKDRIGDKRAIMCADCAYALPDGHESRNIATNKHAQSVRWELCSIS